jgi:hypothetical protein
MSDTREAYKQQYEITKKRLLLVRYINILRRYVYNLNKDERHYFFTEVENYLRNELINNNLNIREVERNAITNLLGHWQITSMESNSTNWWSTLLRNFSDCETFLHIIKSYVENIDDTYKDVNDNNSVATFNNLS